MTVPSSRSSKLSGLLEDPSLQAAFARPQPRPSLAFSLYPPGIPLGALTLIRGARRSEMILRLLSEHRGLRAAWIEERVTAYPPAFVAAGVDLSLLLFVEGGGHFAWALTQLVRSRLFQLVAVASPLRGELELRRLQLAAESSGAAVLLASQVEGPAWPLRLRLEGFELEGELRVREGEGEGEEYASA